PRDLQARHRLPRLRPHRRKLRPPVRQLRRGSRRGRFPPLLARDAAPRARGTHRRLLARGRGRAGQQVPAAGRGPEPRFDLRLRLPVRRHAVRPVHARIRPRHRRRAHRGQGGRGAPGPRDRGRHRAGARGRPRDLRRPVRRLLGVPLAAARAGARRGVGGLVAVAPVRPRRGDALHARDEGDRALHPRYRAPRRLAVAHSAAAPDRQRLRVLERVHFRGRGLRRARRQRRGRAARRAAPAALPRRPPQAFVEPQRDRRRPLERLPRAARIGLDLPCADGDHLPDRTVPAGGPDRPARPRRIQPPDRHGIRPGARLPDPPLPRDRARRFRVLEPRPHDGSARHARRQDGAVARDRPGREVRRRAVLRRELDRGLSRPGRDARAARSAHRAAEPRPARPRAGFAAGRDPPRGRGDARPPRIPRLARRAAGGGAVSAPREMPGRIVVAGAGQVGALAAIALRRALPRCEILVVGTPPDPAAFADRAPTALPFTNRLHDRLGITEERLVREAGGSHRLVVRYLGWGGEGHAGVAPYGAAVDPKLKTRFARDWGGGPRNASTGAPPGSLGEVLAAAGRFQPPAVGPDSPLAALDYALRWNPGAYRDLL